MPETEDFLEFLRIMIKDYEKMYYEHEKDLSNTIEICDNILESKESSQSLKSIALLRKQGGYKDLQRIAAHLSILNVLSGVTVQLKLLEISIDSIDKQLTQSGVIKKAKEIANTEKTLKKLLKSIKDDLKKREETRKKDLTYVQ